MRLIVNFLLLTLFVQVPAANLATGIQNMSIAWLDDGFVIRTEKAGMEAESKLMRKSWIRLNSSESNYLETEWSSADSPGCKMKKLGAFSPELFCLKQSKMDKAEIYLGSIVQITIDLQSCPCIELEMGEEGNAPAIEVWVPQSCSFNRAN